MAYFTGVVAVCAVVQSCMLFGSSGQTDDLIQAAYISAGAARRSAAAAQSFAYTAGKINEGVGNAVGKLERQAGATERAANTAKESLTEVQRAFVFLSIQKNVISQGDGGVHRYSVEIRNSGTTPARSMTDHLNLKPSDLPPKKFDFSDIPATTKTSMVTVGPQSTIGMDHIDLSGDQIKRMIAENKSMYVWGWIHYRDVFPNSKPHVTEFCYRLQGYVTRADYGITSPLCHKS
jgi:hypothetical protein